MALYSLSTIADITKGTVIGKNDLIIESPVTDSRAASVSITSLFIAIKGEQHNGHRYIRDLYSRGVRAFMVSDNCPPEDFPGAGFVKVPDTMKALQDLARHHRNSFNCQVTAITGSNGKTIIKEWLFHCLSGIYNITRSPRSYNSQLGVPLSLWLLDENTELAIIEAGISKPGEMEKLERMISPDTGIFSNIGEAHSENFKNSDEKITEKLKLFASCKELVCCADNEPVIKGILNNPGLSHIRLFSWSLKGKGDVNVTHTRTESGKSLLAAEWKDTHLDITIPFTDHASVENAMHCIAYMILKGIPGDTIVSRMAELPVVAMRLEQKSAINNCTLINDSYNSDLSSLAIALDVLSHQIQHRNRTLILSDILQSGRKHTDLYKKVARMVSDEGITRLAGIGPMISKSAAFFRVPATFYETTDQFIEGFNADDFNNEAILLKGSRSFEFERIAALFEQKKHTTRIEINLNAMIHNLNYFRSLLKPGTKTMVMVKALSYGSGRHEIAGILQFQRVDYLGVAIADEGVSLRKAGINLPIMVMNPEAESFDIMIRNRLEPEIYSSGILSLFEKAVIRNQETNYPVHIKIDSGMHRLGFLSTQTDQLCGELAQHKNIRVCSIFSHLAGSDENQFDSFTHEQISTFKTMSDRIIEKLGYPVIRHILNTSGIERFPEAQFDMVRLGIGLYGVSSTNQEKLRNVSTLKTTILQIKPVNPGETVGYGRKGKPTSPSLIAIIPVGYADGLNRHSGNGKLSFRVNGKFAPTIGNICMDMTMLDVTGLGAKEGDEVIIFGEGNSITDMAQKLDTIPYEILTGVSERVKRIYIYE
ncbi:MAG TPA: bifunctional UDP-N-acetylmuramoyl-tripeptide:D-alanyl-D-alanine ligase/alanine racemase [Bacteroidales bacterium]|nr:bifunctional UDP-N-acetylmuramoyl-tripeptide:D-alanyl-D-alanine ligase/alanine racemase [Bacteroidales bacterium]